MEKSLVTKLCEHIRTREAIELTTEELECLLRITELLTQIETLENLPKDKEQTIGKNSNELEEISKLKHFEGFEKHCFWLTP